MLKKCLNPVDLNCPIRSIGLAPNGNSGHPSPVTFRSARNCLFLGTAILSAVIKLFNAPFLSVHLEFRTLREAWNCLFLGRGFGGRAPNIFSSPSDFILIHFARLLIVSIFGFSTPFLVSFPKNTSL